MLNNWQDSEIRVLNGTEYMCVYDLGRCPLYMKNVPGHLYPGQDYWIDCSLEEVEQAAHEEWLQLEDHYAAERMR